MNLVPVFCFLAYSIQIFLKLFLLSLEEVNKHFDSDEARQCKATDYAMENGASVDDNGNCVWWLRFLGSYQTDAVPVSNFGEIYNSGYDVIYFKSGIRPAMWITIE